MAFTALQVVMAVFFVVNTIMQQQAAEAARERQRKAQQEAEDRSDAAKGMQIVTEGNSVALRVPYGRNLIGGSRVYHKTFNSYTHVAPSVAATVFSASNTLDNSISGSKHEFLITQQAICMAGINAIYQVDVDQRKIDGEYTNEHDEVVFNVDPNNIPAGVKKVKYYDYGCKVITYPNGGIACPTMVAHDAERATALFTNTAYATSIYRLNRDDPQFSGGAPDNQFYVEGMKVHTIIDNFDGTYSLSGTKIYSNNPAYCLLDYLINTVYGRGLDISRIHLGSFYQAAQLCDRTVQADVPLEGALWRAKGTTHDVKLYECNIALDTAKTIRENIELILETMGMAELVWSGGQYKLSLRYPLVYDAGELYAEGDVVQYTSGEDVGLFRKLDNAAEGTTPVVGAHWEDAVDAYITDDDIVREGETSLNWPNAQSRLNYATIRFLNEAKDFTEDSVSWPPKLPGEDGGVVYETYLAEDSNEPLEVDMFAAGITSYYNALAKAEQLVRGSRNLITYELSVHRDFLALEPGDIVKVNSDVLNIPGELLIIEEVKPDTEGVIKLSLTKFDAAVLAWNAKDTEVIPTRNLYDFVIPDVDEDSIAYDQYAETISTSLSAGVITWDAIDNVRVARYRVLVTTNYTGTSTNWMTLGESTTNSFELPQLAEGDYTIAVVPVTSRGQLSSKSGWPILPIVVAFPEPITGFTVTQLEDGTRVFTWDLVDNPRITGYEIRYNLGATANAWASMAILATHITGNRYEDRSNALAPGTYSFRIKGISFSGAIPDASAEAANVLLQRETTYLSDQMKQLIAPIGNNVAEPIPVANIAAAAQQASEAALRLLLKVDELKQRTIREQWISDATVEVDTTAGTVTLLATAEVSTDIEAHLREVDITLGAQDGTILLHTASLDNISGRVTINESDISLLQSEVSLKASSTYVDTVVAEALGVLDPDIIQANQDLNAIGLLHALLDSDAGRKIGQSAVARLAVAERTLTTHADAISAEAAERLILAAQVDANIAAIVAESAARAAADTAEATARTTLAAIVSGHTAAISTEQTTRANADTAISSLITTLTSRVTAAENNIVANASSITSEAATRAAADSAEAALRTTLAARVSAAETAIAANTSSITTEQSARADADSAEAALRVALAARVTTAEDAIVTNAASIASEVSARATGDSANASSISTLTARLDSGDFAAVKVESSANASTITGIQAKYAVKVDVNGHVSGYELISNGTTSAFVVLADKFLVVKPNGTGTPVQMMSLGTVGGVTALGLNGNLIVDGTITADKISVSSLSAITANIGTITAGTLTLNTTGFVRGGQTDYDTGTGFFLGYSGGSYKLSLGNTTNYLRWDGSTLLGRGDLLQKDYTAGTYTFASAEAVRVSDWADPNDDSPQKVKEIKVTRYGSITAYFELAETSSSGPLATAYARVYKNGVAVGTLRGVQAADGWVAFSETISSVVPDDLIQVYAWGDFTTFQASVRNFRLKCGFAIYEDILLD
jgi:hypothetical protein